MRAANWQPSVVLCSINKMDSFIDHQMLKVIYINESSFSFSLCT